MPTLRKHVPGVLGSFVHLDAATEAITTLRSRGFRKLTVYTATPNHEVEEALEHKTSPVRLFTLIGGLTGCAGGFGMTLWMSTDWPVLDRRQADSHGHAIRRHRLRTDDSPRRAGHALCGGAVLAAQGQPSDSLRPRLQQ